MNLFYVLFSARIYTILMDSGDKMLLTNFCLNTSLSISILFASVYFKQTSIKRIL